MLWREATLNVGASPSPHGRCLPPQQEGWDDEFVPV